MRILLVDDHPVVRRGLRQIISEAFVDVVFGEAENGAQTLAQISQLPWDVIVLDVSMPGRSGLEVLGEIKKQRPATPVIILSVHPEDQFAIRGLKAGASGYLTKDSAPEELVRAIQKVLLSKGRYVSTRLAERLAQAIGSPAEEPSHEFLSNREYEVLLLIAAGKKLTEIAQRLHLSIKTVSTYRTRILEKMGASNNADLTRYALTNQLID